jgi:CCR4-NOT transcription complex subunit 3
MLSSDTTQPSQPQLNGNSQPIQSHALPSAGPSPLPQQVQQYTLNAPGLLSMSSPMPSSSQQQPQFPPGVKVPLVSGGEQSAGQLIPPPPQQPQTIGAQRPPSASQQAAQQRSAVASTFPGSLSDLVASFENVKQKGTLHLFLPPHGLTWSILSSPSHDQS